MVSVPVRRLGCQRVRSRPWPLLTAVADQLALLETMPNLFRYQPEAATGAVLSFVGALGLLGATIPRWFSVLVI